MLDLDSLTPGAFVAYADDVYRFVAVDNGRVILTPDLLADLSAGFQGHPAVTGTFTAKATGLTHRATVAHPRHLSRA